MCAEHNIALTFFDVKHLLCMCTLSVNMSVKSQTVTLLDYELLCMNIFCENNYQTFLKTDYRRSNLAKLQK